MNVDQETQQRIAQRDDASWVRAIRSGERMALDDLWVLLYTDALNLIRYRQATEDSAYNAAAKAWEKIRDRGIHQLSSQSSFRAYCRQVVVNAWIDELRRRKLQLTQLEDELISAEPTPPIEPETLRSTLTPCLDHLEQRERRIIELFYFEQQTPAQIGDSLEIKRSHVNVLNQRARKKLRICLERAGFNFADDLL